MRVIKKYDVEKREIVDCKVKKEWRLALWNTDPDDVVNCAQCGIKLRYKDCCTSEELIGGAGIGYGVCSLCSQKERVRLLINNA